jgi:uncharacterized protein (TIGR03067 family)
MKQTIALLATFITPVLAAADDVPQQELKALSGKWACVHFEHKGRVAPEGEAKATFVVEAGGRASVTPEGRERIPFTFVIDPSRSPKQITLTYEAEPSKGTQQFGIYKLEEGKLVLCFAKPGAPKEERPTEFETKGKDRVLLVHERANETK